MQPIQVIHYFDEFHLYDILSVQGVLQHPFSVSPHHFLTLQKILYEKTEFFYVPVLGHIAANTVSVVREETGWLSFGYTTDAKGIGFTAVMLVVAGAVIWGFWKWKKNVEFDERA